MAEAIGVGLIGCGIVGAAVARKIEENSQEISEHAGAPLSIKRVAVKDASKSRDVPLDPSLFTGDPALVVEDPAIQIVVEVMGGATTAGELVAAALKSGKHVVTANKELISQSGPKLADLAAASGVSLLFEGAVAAGVPIIKPLIQSLAGERLNRLMGIVNGTTNFVLTRMSEMAVDSAEALDEAAALGYTELDPSADIQGHDAAAKLAILSSLAFNCSVKPSDVYVEGIEAVKPIDIEFASRLGYVVKLLAIAEKIDGEISARVHPAMVPSIHPLASVRETLNAVFVEGESVGELMFYGQGAGGPQTATAVVGDVIEAARNVVTGSQSVRLLAYKNTAKIRRLDDVGTSYYMLLDVVDKPGVLAQIAGAFAERGVSIRSVWQEGLGSDARLVLITHTAPDREVQTVLKALTGMQVVDKVASAIRVINDDE